MSRCITKWHLLSDRGQHGRLKADEHLDTSRSDVPQSDCVKADGEIRRPTDGTRNRSVIFVPEFRSRFGSKQNQLDSRGILFIGVVATVFAYGFTEALEEGWYGAYGTGLPRGLLVADDAREGQEVEGMLNPPEELACKGRRE